jgi:hypothetical protein
VPIQVLRLGAEIAEQILFAEMIVNAGILPNSTDTFQAHV